MLLDAPDKFLNTHRDTPERKYKLLTPKERMRRRAYSDGIVVTTICRECGYRFNGPLCEGRQWFLEHRTTCR